MHRRIRYGRQRPEDLIQIGYVAGLIEVAAQSEAAGRHRTAAAAARRRRRQRAEQAVAALLRVAAGPARLVYLAPVQVQIADGRLHPVVVAGALFRIVERQVHAAAIAIVLPEQAVRVRLGARRRQIDGQAGQIDVDHTVGRGGGWHVRRRLHAVDERDFDVAGETFDRLDAQRGACPVLKTARMVC